MNNIETMRAFLQRTHAHTNTRNILNGVYYYKGQTLHTEEDYELNQFKLINYSTCIATIDCNTNTLWLNKKKYSTTTSKIQSQLEYLARDTHYDIVYIEGGE